MPSTSESIVIYFRCTRCTGVVRASEAQVGHGVRCPRCGEVQPCPAREDALSAPVATGPVAGRSARGRWLIAAAVALLLAAAAYIALQAGTISRSTSTATSPVERAQRQILEANIGLAGDPSLMRRYDQLNRAHFNGALPSMPVRWEPQLAQVGRAAGGRFTLEGMFGHVDGRPAILLHPNLARDEAGFERTLSHEMVHVYLWRTGDTGGKHGPAFQRELARLADAGAFGGIVASPEEREKLRQWIEAERERLDAALKTEELDARNADEERAALEVEIAQAHAAGSPEPQLATLEARRVEYNRRVTDAGARAAQREADAAELNRQIARYNLMVTYPDGLVEETDQGPVAGLRR